MCSINDKKDCQVILDRINIPRDIKQTILNYVIRLEDQLIADYLEVVAIHIVKLLNLVRDFKTSRENKSTILDYNTIIQILNENLSKNEVLRNEIENLYKRLKLNPYGSLLPLISRIINEKIFDYTLVEYNNDLKLINGLPKTWIIDTTLIMYYFLQHYFHTIYKQYIIDFSKYNLSKDDALKFIEKTLISNPQELKENFILKLSFTCFIREVNTKTIDFNDLTSFLDNKYNLIQSNKIELAIFKIKNKKFVPLNDSDKKMAIEMNFIIHDSMDFTDQVEKLEILSNHPLIKSHFC